MANEIEKPTTLQRIVAGDKTALVEFRKLLRDKPEIVESYASKPRDVLLARIASITKGIAVGAPSIYKEALTAKMDLLRAELSGTQPSAIERLLIERIITCWLQTFDADFQSALRGECTIEQALYDQRRQDQSHKRLLSALKTLAVVRRSGLPIKIDLDLAIGRIHGNSELQSPPEADRIDGAGEDLRSSIRLLTTSKPNKEVHSG